MGDDATSEADDPVHRAAARRIRDEALRLLEEIAPDVDDDEWRIESFDETVTPSADPAG